MLIVDFVLIFCFSMFIFLNLCYLYQRNFILCDNFLFDCKKRVIECIDKNVRCFEKKIALTDTKIEKGFINDTFTNSSLNYYIIYKTTNVSVCMKKPMLIFLFLITQVMEKAQESVRMIKICFGIQ